MFTENLILIDVSGKLISLFKPCPFKWDSKEQKLIPQTSATSLKWIHLRRFIHNLAVWMTIMQYIWVRYLSSEKVDMTTHLISTLLLSCLLITKVSVMECDRHASEIILYINGMFQFDKMYSHGNYTRNGFWGNVRQTCFINQLNIMIVPGFAITGVILSIAFSFGLHLFSPCKSSLVLYWLLPECQNMVCGWPLWNNMLKCTILLLNWWIWSYGICSSLFVVGILLTISFISLKENVKTFWNYYRNDLLPFDKVVRMYRHIQVLARCGNHICQERIVTWIIAAIVIAESLSTCTLVKFTDGWGLVMAVAVICLVDATAISQICFYGFATVCMESRRTIKLLRRDLVNHIGRGGHNMRKRIRFIKSLQLVTVRFGSFNYFDNTTPLRILDVSNAITVNLLLLK